MPYYSGLISTIFEGVFPERILQCSRTPKKL